MGRKEKKIEKYQMEINFLKSEIAMMEMKLSSAMWLDERIKTSKYITKRKNKCEKLNKKVEALKNGR